MKTYAEMVDDRVWWKRLERIVYSDWERGKRFVVRAYQLGAITDWQLWNVLGNMHSPLSYFDGIEVYRALGLHPFAGYPLQKAN